MASYGPLLTDPSWSTASNPAYGTLLLDARRATGWQYAGRNVYQIYVFSGNIRPLANTANRYALIGQTKNVRTFLFEYGLMLGLPYMSEGRSPDPTHGKDIMGSPTNLAEFSAFNRIRLGWITGGMIYKVDANAMPATPITLVALDGTGTINATGSPTTRVIQVVWGAAYQYVLVEKRGSNVYVSFINIYKIGSINYSPSQLTVGKPYLSQNHHFSITLQQATPSSPSMIIISQPAQ
jgi:hypothetical protein